jgi:hypothetical protein
MSDTATPDAPPVFGPSGAMQGNLTSSQGQPPAPAGGSPLAPQSPLATMGAPPAPTPPPQYPAIKAPPMPAAPNLQQNKEPPPDAKEYQKNAMEWASAFAVLGAISGRFTRAPGGAALGAFGAALKGWQSGNLQAYQTAADQWEKQSKQALDNNKLVLEQYKIALENRKMNIDEQMSNIQLIATKYHDQMMYDAAATKNYTMVAQLQEKGWRATAKGYEYHAELSADNQEIKQKQEQNALYWLSPEGTARLPQLSPVQQANVKQIIELYANKQGGGPIDSSTVDKLARQDLTGDQSWKTNVGRGAQGGTMLRAVEARKAEIMDQDGITPEEVSKRNQAFKAQQSGMNREEGAIGQRVGGIAIAVQESKETIPNVLAAAEKSAGRGAAVWNSVENKWKVQKGDPDYAYYVQQMNSLINLYGRVISGGGKGTVSDLEHGRDMLNPNMPLSAVQGALRGFQTEIDIAEKAPGKVRANMRGGAQTEVGAAAPTAPPATAAGDPSKMSDDDLKKKLGL